jgi:pimeloyl-ACP methyl ester carboxylesterase
MSEQSSSPSGWVPLPFDPTISLYYTVDGTLDGTRPVIALSNSLAATTELWADFVTTWRDSYTIVRYDARFHGKSTLPTDPKYDYSSITIEDLAEDLRAVLDHLHIAKLHALIGLSIGAAVALVFGSTWPNRVERVLVVGTKAATDDAVNAVFDQRIALVRDQGPALLASQSVKRWFPGAWIEKNPEKAKAVEDMVAHQKLETYLASVAALQKLGLLPRARKIGQAGIGGRFLFVAGENDGTIPSESKQLAELAGSEIVIIPDTGHIVHVESPEVFDEIVRKALNG